MKKKGKRLLVGGLLVTMLTTLLPSQELFAENLASDTAVMAEENSGTDVEEAVQTDLTSDAETYSVESADETTDEIPTSGTCGVNATWSYADGVLTISGTGAIYDYWVNDYPWTGFKAEIQKVIIEKGITDIGTCNFVGCENLTEVTIPQGCKSIGGSAFRLCTSLKSIEIPEGCELIDGQAFSYCDSLSTVVLPKGCKIIGKEAFFACSNLTNVIIPDGCESIGEEAFEYCTSLTELTIPESCITIGQYAFKESGIKNISIPKSLTTIGNGIFSVCKNLEEVIIPEGCESIEEYAFSNCTNLKRVTIPGSCKYIMMEAFEKCGNLKEVNIGEGCESIGYGAFEYCPISKIVLPKSITNIGSYAFRNSGILFYVYAGSYGEKFAKSQQWNQYEIIEEPEPEPEKKTCNVSFNKNASDAKVSIDLMVLEQDSVYGTLPTATRKNYVFDGWYTTKSGGTRVTSTSTVPKKDNQTLYAHWTKGGYITYVLNGGKNNSKNPSSYKSTQVVTLVSPTRTGYRFNGWYTKYDSQTKKYSGKITQISKGSYGDKKLYASWSPIEYKISFNKNGASNVLTKSMSCKYNTTYKLTKNAYTRKGYIFAGWATSANGAVKYKNRASVKNLTSTNGATVVLYAKWTKNTYKITYNLNGGKNNAKNPATYTVTSTTFSLQNPTRSGYQFKGWYKDSGYKQAIKEIKKGSTGNITVYAKWAVNTYKISFQANGGTGKMNTVSVAYGRKVTLPANTFKRPGYTFQGWSKTASGEVQYKNKSSVTSLTSKNGATVVLYAKWTKNTYKITYNLNGGKNNAKNPATYTVTSTTFSLQNPTRSGYQFKGWYKDSGYKQAIKEIKKGSTGNITVYAKWAVNTYKISFQANGGTGKMNTVSVAYGRKVTLPANAFKYSGYTFQGWSKTAKGGVQYKNKSAVTSLTATNGGTAKLYAQWGFKVTYKKNAADAQGNDVTYTYIKGYAGSTAVPCGYVRQGYQFDSWNTKADGSGQSYAAGSYIGDLKPGTVLYAQWKVAYQKAMWFMNDLDITQVPGGDYSHKGTQNFDVIGVNSNDIFAPFDCKVVAIYPAFGSGNTVIVESLAPVLYADGRVDYMSMAFAHDNDISNISIGKIIKQGEVFYQTGTYGNVSGRHSHVTCIAGTYQNDFWTQNSDGNYCSPNAIAPTSALFISSSTNIVNTKGLNFVKAD